MFLTDLSIKRPVVASVMSLVLVIFGLITFQEIPVLSNVKNVMARCLKLYRDPSGAEWCFIGTEGYGIFMLVGMETIWLFCPVRTSFGLWSVYRWSVQIDCVSS